MNTSKPYTCRLCGHVSEVFLDKATDFAYCPGCHFPVRASGAIPLGDNNLMKYLELCPNQTVVCFWAPWDSNSREFMPVFDSTANRPKISSALISVNIQENPETKRLLGISLIPTLIVFQYGRETNRVLGPLSPFDLDRFVDVGGV